MVLSSVLCSFCPLFLRHHHLLLQSIVNQRSSTEFLSRQGAKEGRWKLEREDKRERVCEERKRTWELFVHFTWTSRLRNQKEVKSNQCSRYAMLYYAILCYTMLCLLLCYVILTHSPLLFLPNNNDLVI